MSDQQQPACFAKVDVAAVPEAAAQVRHEFSDWLHSNLMLDSVKASDVLLAVSEALANAAEFAYVSSPEPGVMHLRADYDPTAAVLTVTVADQGIWRSARPPANNPARGRGIPLMRALCDHAIIDSSPVGTQVRLRWDHISGSL
ncbi:ATP-binding protein [Mycolicibacterium sp. 120322]|uniref:ATP-binding protein n=1 Tax=Mycolicibacterium sp. 120322 TaxID=3096109 RepID=UPI002EDA1FC6